MGFIKNLMKMVYISNLTPFIANDITISVKSNDIMSLDLEMLSALKELVETKRRVDVEYLNEVMKIKLKIGDQYQIVISLDNVTINDEVKDHTGDHYIWIEIDLNESMHMSISIDIDPEEIQLKEIYAELDELQDEINELYKPTISSTSASGH